QRVSNRVRVNAQLIDARNDAHLWAQTYDRDLADVFAIQSEIAKAIADQLQAKLSPAEKSAIEQRPTSDIAAFELYSRANDLILNIGFSTRNLQKLHSGIDLLNQALARDPSFFAAQCLLARAHDSLLALLDWKADTQALHQTIDEIRTKDPDAIKSAADVWFICALAERDAATAEAALAALGDGRLFTDNATSFNADFGRALVARMTKD